MTYTPHVEEDLRRMLKTVGVKSLDDLFSTIPEDIRLKRELNLPPALAEPELRRTFETLASKSRTDVVSFVGGGVYDHFIPAVVETIASRGEFLTAYTPYQAEVSQGTLQAFFEYQTLLCELTGCEVSNASMYDGASATAEAVLMARAITRRKSVAVDAGLHPEYREVLETYLHHLDGDLRTVAHEHGTIQKTSLAQALATEPAVMVVQSPDFFGIVHDLAPLASAAHAAGALLVAVVDPISLGLLKRPGKSGADIVVGEGQPLGNPVAFGGPGFGFMTTRRKFVRKMPGRLVGEAADRRGKSGYVLTLQAREQHIRRGRATSNICTNHALTALRGAVYLSLMGPEGLRRVAALCLAKAHYAAERLAGLPGVSLRFADAPFFKEFVISFDGTPAHEVRRRVIEHGIDPGLDLGRFDDALERAMLVAVTEQRTRSEIDRLVETVGREVHA